MRTPSFCLSVSPRIPPSVGTRVLARYDVDAGHTGTPTLVGQKTCTGGTVGRGPEEEDEDPGVRGGRRSRRREVGWGGVAPRELDATKSDCGRTEGGVGYRNRREVVTCLV